MNLLERTRKFIEKENLFHKNNRLLLGVSGGADSMVMAHLLTELGYKVGFAHVNYKLREKDSDLDATLVAGLASKNRIPYYLYELTPDEVKDIKQGNLQSKARNIRYDFFNQTLVKYGYDFICTAHHANDRSETYLIQSIRISGSRGLSSISAISDNIRRPLLYLTSREILAYAKEASICYRVDESNTSSVYDRNFIRNEVMPVLRDRWENVDLRLNKTADLLKNENLLINHLIESEKDKWVTSTEEGILIERVEELRHIPGIETFLYYILEPYGYHLDDIIDILRVHDSGALFYSKEYVLLYDRDQLLLKKANSSYPTNVSIPAPGRYSYNRDKHFAMDTKSHFIKVEDATIEIVDADKIKYPLVIRNWHQGDIFCPIGMNGQKKKISDLFTDLKLNLFEKEEIRILSTEDQIIWIMGIRLDDRFKVTPDTTNYMQLSISSEG